METIDKNIFQDQKSIQDFSCPNCNQVAIKPYISNCKHFFCGGCILKDHQCKICEIKWNKNELISINDNLHDDRKVKCLEDQCTWTGKFKNLQKHKKNNHTVRQKHQELDNIQKENKKLKNQLKQQKKINQKQEEKNHKLINELQFNKSQIQELQSQVDFLKKELYNEEPTILEKEKVIKKKPESLTIENFKESQYIESKYKKIISDYFNPRSILIKQDYSFKLPFQFTFEVQGIKEYQTEVGFIVLNKQELIGKISISNERIEVKINGKKHYTNLSKNIITDNASLKFELNKKHGEILMNKIQSFKNFYPIDIFRYGDNFKFYPYYYAHFHTQFNRTFIAHQFI